MSPKGLCALPLAVLADTSASAIAAPPSTCEDAIGAIVNAGIAQRKPDLSPYAQAVPALTAGTDDRAEWQGHLRSIHFLAARLVRYSVNEKRGVAKCDFRTELCPHRNPVVIQRADLPGGAALPPVEHVAGEFALRHAIERAYREAQRILPRPLAPAGQVPCKRTKVEFKPA